MARLTSGSFSVISRLSDGDDNIGAQVIAPYGVTDELPVMADDLGIGIKRSRVLASATAVEPYTDALTDVGRAAKRFKAAYFSGEISAATAAMTGAIAWPGGVSITEDGAGTLALGVPSGVNALTLTNAAVTASLPLSMNSHDITAVSRSEAADGTAAAPSYTFTTDTDTGLYCSAANTLGVTTGGTSRLAIGSTDIKTTVPLLGADGAVATPTYAFSSATGTGVYRNVGDLAFAIAGNDRLFLGDTYLQPFTPINSVHNGTAASPSYRWNSDTNTGIYNPAADTVAISTGGTERAKFESARFTSNHPVLHPAGSAALPGCAIAQGNTGLYQPAANQCAMSVNTTQTILFGATDRKSVV